MKAGWEIKTLGEVCEKASSNVSQNQLIDEIGNYPIYGASGFIKNVSFYHRDKDYISIVKDGAGIGRLTLMKAYSSVIGTLQYLTPKDGLDINFLYYFLSSVDFLKYKNGSTIPHIYFKDYSVEPVPLPPLPEQKRLVTLLDEAFESIATAKANAQQNLKNARALFESHLNEVFAECAKKYGHKTVGEISKNSLGKMLDKAKNKGEFKPYLRNINVRWFNFDLSDTLEMKFLPEETEKYTAVKGDVLICEGGYPGRAAIWQNDEPIYFQKALHRVRFHEIEHNKWFVYFLFSQDSGGSLRQYFTGAGIQHFTGSALKQFKIPIPPIEETKLYIAKFDTLAEETQRLEALYSRKIAALDELKKALLHLAFSGEL